MCNIFLDNGRKKYLLVNILCFALTLVAVALLSSRLDGQLGASRHWELLPTMLLSSFCGPLTAALMELTLFIYNAFVLWNIQNTFRLFVILASAIIAFVPIRYGWYKSKLKSLLAIPFFSVSIAAAFFMSTLAYEARDVTNNVSLWGQLKGIGSIVPYAYLVVTVCYAFFNHAPERMRSLFLGARYFSENKVSCSPEERRRRWSVKNKVTGLIIVEALVLCNAAMVFAFILFNDNANRLTEGSPLPQMFITGSLIQTNFAMLLSMLNFSVPIILIANSFAVNRIAAPIRLMALGMDSFTRCTISDKGSQTVDLHELDIRTGDEIQDLYEALSSTTAQLADYIASLEREQRLREEVKVEKAANQAKTSFLSSMSHEIRTPINAVLGLDEMILRESDEDHIIRYAADIKSAGRSLLSLINDILDFSKIESGKLEIINAEYDLGSMINDLVNMINARAEDKGLKLVVNVMPDTPRLLYGDEIRIKQCVLNILTNAVKYTREGSVTLEIGWEEAGEAELAGDGLAALGGAKTADDRFIMLRARVVDTGIGIKEEDIPKLFHAFERIEEKRNRTIEGTGLGMNIVQSLLSLMGTQLEVKSVYGKGSDFSFRVLQRVIESEGVGDFSEIYRKSAESASSYRASFTAPDAHILCVDDTAMNLTVFKGLLKETKVQIDTATSGVEALRCCAEKHYDILFIDHMMPTMDGIETLHALEHLDTNRCRGVPAIALTANAISGAREMYIKEGFTDYLTKPVNSIKLEKMIAHYLPPEKVLKAEEADGLASAPAEEAPRLSDPVLQRLSLVPGLDIARSLKACGSPDVCKDVLKQYAESGPDTLDTIQYCMKKGDWKNYTVKVHALKSSSRLAGLDALGEAAASLEQSGHTILDSQPGNPHYEEAMAEIQAKTPVLMEDYKKLILALMGAL